MEEDPKMKFVCKVCNKRYPCGKSLGGHLRSHRIVNSAQKEEKAKATMEVLALSGGRNSKRDSVSEAGGLSGYGLRENPKKTWRFVDSSTNLQQGKVCKDCGKAFQSLKALSGHMACHSAKEKGITKSEDDSGSNEKQKLVVDGQSDTETSALRRRRSKRMRYKALDVSSSSLANASSSVSEIEQEQEEVAMCLMMLSRDSGYRGGLNLVADSSDNNSMILESKSSSTDMKFSMKNDLNCASNVNEFVRMKKPKERKFNSAEIDLYDNSDSGYFRNGPKKVDSDVSVDGFHKKGDFRKLKVEYGSAFEDIDAELGKSIRRFKCTKSELGKKLIKEEGYGQVDRISMKFGLRKRGNKDSELWEDSHNKITNGSANLEVCKNAQKINKYELLTSTKSFHTHRGLGGHETSHKNIDGGCFESGENNIGTDSLPVPVSDRKIFKSCSGKNPIDQSFSSNAAKRLGSKKSKGHECPICFRIFRSGQALGGHKRSHFIGGVEDRTVIIRQEFLETSGLLDLNLPPPSY